MPADTPSSGGYLPPVTSLQKGTEMKKKALSLTAVGVGIGLALAFTATPASADPNPPTDIRPLAGMGSDTTFDVMNALSEVTLIGGNKAFSSYNPLPAGQLVSTKAAGFTNPNCNTTNPGGGVPRANGSGAGRDALTASMTVGNAIQGCLDFARSSSTTVNANQTFVPMATDGLTYAYPLNGDIGSSATLADLQGIYSCTITGFAPLIPQSGSGTRTSWATLMGISATTLPACVHDVKAGTATPIEEHDGRVFTAGNQLVPFSVAQYISQTFGAAADRRGTAQLGQIGAVSPLLLNPNQASTRVIGNILPTTEFNNAASISNDVFVNNGTGTSQICVTGKATIERFGFLASSCP
jgi:ABC-type phosphate transport system substrate-binding protein